MKATQIKFLDNHNVMWAVALNRLNIVNDDVTWEDSGFNRLVCEVSDETLQTIEELVVRTKRGETLPSFPDEKSSVIDIEAYYAHVHYYAPTTCEEEQAKRLKHAALKNAAPSSILKPIIDDIKLFGMVDRTLSEMKYIVDHPGEFDSATFQTLKHHIEDMDLFVKHATGKLTKLDVIKSLPPVAEQRERGY